MMEFKLLSGGGLGFMRGVKFPCVVRGFHCPESGCVKVSSEELLKVGADGEVLLEEHDNLWNFLFGDEAVYPDYGEQWPTDDRIDAIGQNGNTGEHYAGRKDDGDKPMMNLIPPAAELALARVLTFGAKKYAPENWRLVDEPESRYLAAAMRHINAHRSGELRDPESGELHLSHALCCMSFLVELQELNK